MYTKYTRRVYIQRKCEKKPFALIAQAPKKKSETFFIEPYNLDVGKKAFY